MLAQYCGFATENKVQYSVDKVRGDVHYSWKSLISTRVPRCGSE